MTSASAASDVIYVPEWTFADKFRKARQTTGMEQREFADALGLTSSTVASYETGRSAPRFKDAGALAKRLQVLTRIDYRWFLDTGSYGPIAGGSKSAPSDYKPGLSGEVVTVDFTRGRGGARFVPAGEAG